MFGIKDFWTKLIVLVVMSTLWGTGAGLIVWIFRIRPFLSGFCAGFSFLMLKCIFVWIIKRLKNNKLNKSLLFVLALLFQAIVIAVVLYFLAMPLYLFFVFLFIVYMVSTGYNIQGKFFAAKHQAEEQNIPAQ